MADGTGTGATITPEQLTAAARALGTSVPPQLATASADLQQASTIAYDNFTAVSPALATAYNAACQFLAQDLAHKKQLVTQIGEALDDTARTWSTAEQRSDVGSR